MTNTVALAVVAVAVALVLVGIVAWFGVKFRAERRILGCNGILDEAAQDTRLVDELLAKGRVPRNDRD